MSLDEILLDTLHHDLFDRMNALPPPPSGYTYAYDFPEIRKTGEVWEIYANLCLKDGHGRLIRLARR